MTDVDGLPRPAVSLDRAAELARELFGLTGVLTELGSQQDRNFLVDGEAVRHLLKISNPATELAAVAAQNAAMLRVQSSGLAAPVPIAAPDGRPIVEVEIDGRPHRVRALTFVEGAPLIDRVQWDPATVEAFGAFVGEVAAALAPLTDPGLVRSDQWDLRNGVAVVADRLRFARTDTTAELAAAAAIAERAIRRVGDRLPLQPIHGDLTDDNVVVTPDGALGAIDFGDAMVSWRVAELAVAITGVLDHTDDPFDVLPAVVAFDRAAALTDEEIAALWPLVLLRGAVLVVSGEQQVAVDPGNAYADDARPRELAIFRRAASVDHRVMTAGIRRALRGDAVSPPARGGRLLGVVPDVIDLNVGSDAFGPGSWLEGADTEAALVRGSVDGGGAAAFRYGEPRLTRSRARESAEPRNVPVMVEVHLGSEATISAPFAGEVAATAAGLSVRSRDRCVLLAGELAGVRPGPVAEGDAVASARGPLTVWAVEAGDGEECPADPPTFVRASDFEAHAAVFRDPSALLGIPEGRRYRRRDPVDLLERRDRALGLLQAHYYERPPEIERGWREHLIDVDGRHYLDMVNNVTILGHGHPAIAAAASRQWGMLNTNSRFHYEAVVELAERLLATVTPPLDTVFLVNSGSEAVDLALRLGAAFTGRRDVLCVEESYHGWTLASDAVSTAVSDNPMAQETRPGWVHALDAPNSYRGRHRGDDAGAAYAHDAEATIAGLERAGTPIGTFIAEPRNGNAGAIGLPAGYLTRVAAAVRGQGGVCLSDEVQVGYGRQGDWFWGYEEHGVVPDILTVAKAMGDGHPLGAVITTRAIAESLAPKGTFFSSAGGSTLSARIGLAVLDIMEAEGLQENARRTGALLSELLAELAERQPLIGAVHGRGLYQGVELVRDRDTLEPADTETAWVCDRMLGLGVIEQPTGDRGNILKVKPPLCFTPESARFYVAALDRALRECTSRIR